jgi:hypothetical protein
MGSPIISMRVLTSTPFDRQHLKPLYHSHERYVDDVTKSINSLVLQRCILREDGNEIIRHAKNSDVPTLADIPSDIPDDLKLRRNGASCTKSRTVGPGAKKGSYLPLSSRLRFNWNAALISDMWVNACGKLPRCSPDGPSSSGYSPR